MSLNKVMLIGNVGNEPNVRYVDKNIQNNTKVATFPLATSERYRDRDGAIQEKTEWHNIVAWRGLADLIEKYIHKGSRIFIEGHLTTRRYTDAQTGAVRYITEIVSEKVQLLDRRESSGENSGVPAGQNYQPRQNFSQQPAQDDVQQDAPIPQEEPSDDLPF